MKRRGVGSGHFNAPRTGRLQPANAHAQHAVAASRLDFAGIDVVRQGNHPPEIAIKALFSVNADLVGVCRQGAFTLNSSDTDITFESFYVDYGVTSGAVSRQSTLKGCGFTGGSAGAAGAYGTHWGDFFTSATAGKIVIFGNEPIYRTYEYAPRICYLSPIQDQISGAIVMKVFNEGFSLLTMGCAFFRWAKREA